MNIIKLDILKRTFEGVDNPRLNDDVLTSRYSPSKKWLLRYKIEGYDHFIDECFTTKKLAKQRKSKLELEKSN